MSDQSGNVCVFDDLELYAIGALPAQEERAFRAALLAADPETQARIEAKIVRAREAATALVASAELDVPVPASARAVILARIEDQGSGSAVIKAPPLPVRRKARLLAVAAAAALLVGGGFFMTIQRVGGNSGSETATFDAVSPGPLAVPRNGGSAVTMAQQISASSDVVRNRVDLPNGGSAIVSASPGLDAAVLEMANMPSPGAHRHYQLWRIGPDDTPTAAGALSAESSGSEFLGVITGLADSGAVALTDEPNTGSAPPLPTGEVLFALPLA